MTGEWIGFAGVIAPAILLGLFFWLRFRARREMQDRYLAEIQERFDTPLLTIDLLPREVQGLEMLADLGDRMYREPVAA